MKTSENLSKMEVAEHFTQIYEDEHNTLCFECGKKSKQWAEVNHAIFLCLTCAAAYKEVPHYINVKSISLDLWSQEELELLKRGGNTKFKEFLRKY